MRKAAQKIMSHLAPVFWAGAVGALGLLLMSDPWDLGDARSLLGAVVLLSCAAISAQVCRAIERAAEKTHDDCIDLLLKALASTRRPTPAASQPRHHRPAA